MADVFLPPKIVEIFAPPKMRYRGAYGGRGSGKTRSFATMAAIRGYQLASQGKSGLIVCAREFVNTLADSTYAEVKLAISAYPWLAAGYEVGESYIRTKDRRINMTFAGLRHNIESLKSKAEIHLLWVDEAQNVSERAWQTVNPTVRAADSEIWATWNPRFAADATEQRFRANPPKEGGCIVREVNWSDNPWFPAVLDIERRNDLLNRPEAYPHIWQGAYQTVQEGAYWTRHLLEAREQGRMADAEAEPTLPVKAFFDLGGSSGRADATAIWCVQFVGDMVKAVNYMEGVGQPWSYYADWLRNTYKSPQIYLPHDGKNISGTSTQSWQDALYQAGFGYVEVIPNQGKGAALMRIDAVRQVLPRCVFNARRCAAGIEALQAYHEKRDPNRNIGLGPEHDWSSHAADAFGLMGIVWKSSRSFPSSQYGQIEGGFTRPADYDINAF